MTIQDIAKSLNLEASEYADENAEPFLSIESIDGNGIDYYLDDNVFIEWVDGNSLKANEPDRMPAVEEIVNQWRAIKEEN